MTHANLVASEVKFQGFRTKVFTSNSVIVSLTNRKVSTMEVEKVLEQIFDAPLFTVQSTTGAVLVSW